MSDDLLDRQTIPFTDDLGYRYPAGLDLRPSSRLHSELLAQIRRRAQRSWAWISQRHDTWRETDRTLRAYIDLSKNERELKEKDPRKPVSIVVPLSYMILETLLTHWQAALGQEPIFRYTGRGPEDQLGAILLELVVQQQMEAFGAPLAIHQMGRDAFVYGFGALTPIWRRREGWRTVRTPMTIPDPITGVPMAMPGMEQRTTVPAILDEGCSLEDIDPYCYLPDPQAPVGQPEKGEYAGWHERTHYSALLAEEQSGGPIFNVRYLNGRDNRCRMLVGDNDAMALGLDAQQDNATQPVDQVWMYVRLIPSEWTLGSSNSPELWLFRIAGDQVILSAGPAHLDHGMIPLGVAVPDGPNRGLPQSRMEIIAGLQTTANFLNNSHIENVRKSLNDMFLIDPSLVNIHDIATPGPGKLIRLRPGGWGRGVDQVMKQFNVTDVTQQHMVDLERFVAMAQQSSGATDITMGVIRSKSGERRTAEETQGMRAAALSRLQLAATKASYQAMRPLGRMVAMQTQQLMSQARYVSIVGRHQQDLREIYGITEQQVPVDPMTLLVDIDVAVGDGTGGAGDMASEFMQALQVAASNQELAMNVDLTRVYLEGLRRMGIPNPLEFRRKMPLQPQVTVMGDADLRAAEQAGNVVPAGSLMR